MTFENRYGRLDRALHRFAFRTLFAQEALSDLEDRMFADAIGAVDLSPPVFLSGLPRSGTTILLDLLASTGAFATHTYRDMPFVLCPLLWDRFSRNFAVSDRPRERAHGDGVQISLDSAESFEEIVWKRFWPEHYGEDRIEPWKEPVVHREFDSFFLQHMKKIIVARRGSASSNLRYLSKNNVTIARLSTLPGPLREGVILVPFREPLQQAASLLAQHERFLALHPIDPFARQYVTDVGHSEFGLAHRPIDFGGWLQNPPDSRTLEYWVRYWTVAYRHVAESLGPKTRLISYMSLIRDPPEVLGRIARWIGLDPDALREGSDRVSAPGGHEIEEGRVPAAVLDGARRLHEELEGLAATTT